jgi:predicted esterase
MKYGSIFLSLTATITLAHGCGGDGTSTNLAGSASGSSSVSSSGSMSSSSGEMGGAGGASSSSSSSSSSGQGGGGYSFVMASCNDTPPAGAKLAPDPKKYSGGTCPTLVDGHNAFPSGAAMRDFRLVSPVDKKPDERLPVLFLWHWLGGSADDFYERGQIQLAADTQRFIAVIPESKGDIQFKWPFDILQSQGRMDEEFAFFDDMLACVSEQFNVNKECVGSAGVSAGALFTGQLAGGRGEYLSSIVSLSGGTGGSLIKPFANPEHRMPAVVLWGGPTDNCFQVMNFEQTSTDLEKNLDTRGHFFVECIHNCGHAEPPLDAPLGLSTYAPMWQFVLDHPYWLGAGESPYANGLPKDMPAWCGVGTGSSTPRTGTCPGSPGC